VAFTDHDSIDGALELLNDRPDYSDVIIGEEVSCWLPDDDIEVHLAVYGMTESLHRDLQPLRRNVFDVAARLRDAGVVFALNHPLHFYRGRIPLGRYLRILHEVPALEARNGAMLAGQNRLIERLAQQTPAAASPTGRFGVVGGSDAHTLRRVGTTWTSAPGRTPDEFLAGVRGGTASVGGAHGTASTISGDTYGVIVSYLAALAGFGPRDLSGWHRAACCCFGAASVPFQFMPALIAVRTKFLERRAVAALAAHFEEIDRMPAAAELQTIGPS
jgi:predicted metal-dependent phosphoesterase TrpH